MTIRHLGMASLLVTLCACGDVDRNAELSATEAEDNVETGAAEQALMEPLDKRTIPIRAIALADSACSTRPQSLCGSSCGGSAGEPDSSRLEQGIATANAVYAAAGIEFKLRSFDVVQAPRLWCPSPGWQTWANVKSEVTAAFPEVPSNAWLNTEQKGGIASGASKASDWWKAAAGTYASSDEIVMIIGGAYSGSSGDFPHVGKVINMSTANLIGNTVGHELGHYLGLAHPGDTAFGADPETDLTWKKSARYDLMFRAKPSNGGPEFYDSASDASVYESSLQLIKPSCSYAAGTCNLSCTLAGSLLTAGDPRIDALVRLYPDSSVGVNIMENPPTGCTRHIAPSQADNVWSFLNYEPPVSTEFAERVDTLPSGFSAGDLTAGRSRLGLVRSFWSDQANFCRTSSERLYAGYFNNDDRVDLLCNQTDDGDMLVNLAQPDGSFNGSDWISPGRNFCRQAGEHLYIGDFNNDNRDDLLCNQDDGDMLVDFADTSGRFEGSNWIKSNLNFCVGSGDRLYIGDFDGNGSDDLLCNRSNGDMLVDFADASGEFAGADWTYTSRNFCVTAGETLYVGKFNADSKDDLLCNQSDGEMLIDFAGTTSALFTGSNWIQDRDFCLGSSAKLHVADINRDGRDDLLCRNQSTGKTEVGLANTSGQFPSIDWRGNIDGWCSGSSVKDVYLGDTDNQYGADIICNETNGKLSVARLRLEP
ncbi:hypothetical protein [Polyangium sorediatum]|uniref:Uncharacterized protein n=1 Tax=Polyangium sorediatum TaxID=889274 RepID=A0ABT6P884_9BACT|nr:hypothetical protein [Polyangium sorediatum]MDI1436828.1 hypothetical protein [Polyangium sorediatum]